MKTTLQLYPLERLETVSASNETASLQFGHALASVVAQSITGIVPVSTTKKSILANRLIISAPETEPLPDRFHHKK